MKEDANITDLTRTVTADTPKEFLDAISPLGPFLDDGNDSTSWIFRGEPSDQRNDVFSPLVPTALRPAKRKELWRLGRLRSWDQSGEPEFYQVYAEFLVLREFFEYADKCGLPIPEDKQSVRKYLQHSSRFEAGLKSLTGHGFDWVPDGLLSLAGLAQHYGLPTRLLDWTRDYLVAAYFAAKAVLTGDNDAKESDDFLVVWALKESAVYACEGSLSDPTESPLRIVTAPAAVNPNLHAQRGLFTTWSLEHMSKQVDRRPLNTRLAEDDEFKKAIGDEAAFLRVRLPHSQARSLFQDLIRLGVTAGKLFPGFEGAAKSVRDFDLAFGEDIEW